MQQSGFVNINKVLGAVLDMQDDDVISRKVLIDQLSVFFKKYQDAYESTDDEMVYGQMIAYQDVIHLLEEFAYPKYVDSSGQKPKCLTFKDEYGKIRSDYPTEKLLEKLYSLEHGGDAYAA